MSDVCNQDSIYEIVLQDFPTIIVLPRRQLVDGLDLVVAQVEVLQHGHVALRHDRHAGELVVREVQFVQCRQE